MQQGGAHSPCPLRLRRASGHTLSRAHVCTYTHTPQEDTRGSPSAFLSGAASALPHMRTAHRAGAAHTCKHTMLQKCLPCARVLRLNRTKTGYAHTHTRTHSPTHAHVHALARLHLSSPAYRCRAAFWRKRKRLLTAAMAMMGRVGCQAMCRILRLTSMALM